MLKPQPYSKTDLVKGEQIARQLLTITSLEEWTEVIAKAIAAERERILAEPDKFL